MFRVVTRFTICGVDTNSWWTTRFRKVHDGGPSHLAPCIWIQAGYASGSPIVGGALVAAGGGLINITSVRAHSGGSGEAKSTQEKLNY